MPSVFRVITAPTVLLATVLSSGCDSLFPAKPTNLIADMEFDESLGPGGNNKKQTSVREFARNQFLNDLKAATASTLPPTDINAAESRTDDPALNNRLFKSGRAYLDLECSAYMDWVANQLQDHSADRQAISLSNGFASTIMGLANTPAKIVAGSSATFSFVGANVGMVDSIYLFSESASPLVQLIHDAQSAYLKEIGNPTNLDYASTINLLTGYEEICRPVGIRRLVNESLSKAQPVASPTNGASRPSISIKESVKEEPTLDNSGSKKSQ